MGETLLFFLSFSWLCISDAECFIRPVDYTGFFWTPIRAILHHHVRDIHDSIISSLTLKTTSTITTGAPYEQIIPRMHAHTCLHLHSGAFIRRFYTKRLTISTFVIRSETICLLSAQYSKFFVCFDSLLHFYNVLPNQQTIEQQNESLLWQYFIL